ncbi:MAG: hypothetical protein R2752_10585 [Vicinamibacterales bacterium]
MPRTHRTPPPVGSERPARIDRHHGGQQPPDDAQHRPEQDAGYDRAVSEGVAGEPGKPEDPESVDRLPGEPGADLDVHER